MSWRWSMPRLLRDGGAGLGLERADAVAGAGRLVFADHPAHFVEAGFDQRVVVEGRVAGEQLVEQHAQRIDIAARIDVEAGSARPARGSCRAACRPAG